jgi:cytochrome c peroxidase
LPDNVKQAVARTYRYVMASKSAHEAQGRKIYFEKRLEINSKQMLKTKPKN